MRCYLRVAESGRGPFVRRSFSVELWSVATLSCCHSLWISRRALGIGTPILLLHGPVCLEHDVGTDGGRRLARRAGRGERESILILTRACSAPERVDSSRLKIGISRRLS